jgi:hypothetical protein
MNVYARFPNSTFHLIAINGLPLCVRSSRRKTRQGAHDFGGFRVDDDNNLTGWKVDNADSVDGDYLCRRCFKRHLEENGRFTAC